MGLRYPAHGEVERQQRDLTMAFDARSSSRSSTSTRARSSPTRRSPAGLAAPCSSVRTCSSPRRVRAAWWRLRRLGLGVALDDVGADRRSLALMPFVAPDVIKLDLR